MPQLVIDNSIGLCYSQGLAFRKHKHMHSNKHPASCNETLEEKHFECAAIHLIYFPEIRRFSPVAQAERFVVMFYKTQDNKVVQSSVCARASTLEQAQLDFATYCKAYACQQMNAFIARQMRELGENDDEGSKGKGGMGK